MPEEGYEGDDWGVCEKHLLVHCQLADMYRDRLKGLYVVARRLFLLLLTCSASPCLGPA